VVVFFEGFFAVWDVDCESQWVAEGASSGGGVDAGSAVEVWGDAECGVGVCGRRGGVGELS
jgi:hypothetical protein